MVVSFEGVKVLWLVGGWGIGVVLEEVVSASAAFQDSRVMTTFG